MGESLWEGGGWSPVLAIDAAGPLSKFVLGFGEHFGLGEEVHEGGGDGLCGNEHPRVDAARYTAKGVSSPGRIEIARAGRLQGRAAGAEADGGGVPGVVNVVVGGVVGLPSGELASDLRFKVRGGDELLAFVGEGVAHWGQAQILLDGA